MGKDILILCQYFYPENISSAILPEQLAEELTLEGHNVNIICGWPQEYYNGKHVSKNEVHKGFNIKRIKYGKLNNKSKFGRIVNFFSFFVSMLFKIFEIGRHEIVIVYSNPPILPLIGYWAKVISKNKLIFVGFDLYPDNAIVLNLIKKSGLIHNFMNYINKRVYLNADKIIAISDDMKESMIASHKQLDEEIITVIPNWYTGNIARTDKIFNKEFESIKKNWKLIVLYTGNMGEAQDLDTIVNSIIIMDTDNKFRETFFIFTGHGSSRKRIEQKLSENNVRNVQFYGFLEGKDYQDILNIADICLVSLKKGIEGLGVPSKTYGYFAYGKPVVSIMSDKTELAKNIDLFQAGFNIHQNDTSGFIRIIEEAIDNPDMLDNLSKNSLKIHEVLYNKNKSLKAYVNIINQIEKGKINV